MAEKDDKEKTKEKFENILNTLSNEKENVPGLPPSFFNSIFGDGTDKKQKQPSSSAEPKSEAPASSAGGNEKVRQMEEELRQEREKALKLDGALKEKENMRLELEKRIAEMSQIKKEIDGTQRELSEKFASHYQPILPQLASQVSELKKRIGDQVLESKKRIGKSSQYEGGTAPIMRDVQQQAEKFREREAELLAENENLRRTIQSWEQHVVELQARTADLEVKLSLFLSDNPQPTSVPDEDTK